MAGPASPIGMESPRVAQGERRCRGRRPRQARLDDPAPGLPRELPGVLGVPHGGSLLAILESLSRIYPA